MKNFKYLECDNVEAISEKIYHYLQVNTAILDEPIDKNWTLISLDILTAVPELANFFTDLNLVPKIIHVLKTNQTRDLHVDYSPDIRIMFPVSNTVGTAVTNFYELEGLTKIPIPIDDYIYYKIFYTSQKNNRVVYIR
jgi:hypothetical protein